ncbi:Nuclear receptor corepressor-like [Oopsacas minuta]|uniref:Nuclear receptor corepressor-like n=1 Tax=Oopsacas minuta TaxID=111878 RepID=A0AAV7JPQ0_9METZ|nr:Nuclear receptor corepressor-like [Oopsacas minuta]
MHFVCRNSHEYLSLELYSKIQRYTNWTPDEVEKLRTALLQHGKSWNKIQQVVGKPHLQCKMFYNDFSSIEEYGLQQALEERYKRKAKERQDKLAVDPEDPLPLSTIRCPEELSDTDSPPRRPSDPLPLKENISHLLLLEHSYHTRSSQAVTRKVCHSSVHGGDPTQLTVLSPATHTRLMKALRDSCHCRSGLPRVRKYRRSSAAALLQPSNHRRLSSSTGGSTLNKRTTLATERSRVSQERPSSDTTLEHTTQTREINYSAVMTSIEPTTPLISSEVVTEIDTPTAGGFDKREQRNSSDYDSDQEGGRLVIDTDADDVIVEQAHPVTQGGSYTSLPDLERVEDQEVFQSDETSELSPDVLTELSPTQPIRARFEDAWAYRSSEIDPHWSSDPTSFKFEEYSDLEPDTIGLDEGDVLVERINRINFPRTDPPPKKLNPFSRIDTTLKQRNVEVSRPIPIKLKHKHPKASLPIEIQRTLKSLEGQQKLSQDLVWSDHKRNGHSPPPKKHKRFKPEISNIQNGNSLKEEPLEDKEALRLQYLAQCRPDLYQQHGILPYPSLYHPLSQLLLQNPYLSPPLLPPTGKLILPPGIQFPINKQHEPILVQNPMTSTMSHSFPPPLLLQGSGLYPIPYPAAPPPDGPTQPHGNHRGPKSNT